MLYRLFVNYRKTNYAGEITLIRIMRNARLKILAFRRQVPDGQRVREYHHAQRNIKAHYRSNQFVQRIWYLTRTVYQHRVEILKQKHGTLATFNEYKVTKSIIQVVGILHYKSLVCEQNYLNRYTGPNLKTECCATESRNKNDLQEAPKFTAFT